MAAAPAAAAPITLRNCLDPALLTTHDLTVTLVQKASRAGVREEAALEMKGRLTRAHLDESQPGRVKTATMLLMEPARVTALFRDDKPVAPLPGPELFGLPPRGALRFNTHVQTSWDGASESPALRPAEEALLAALLDVSHWPKKTVELKHAWSRAVDSADFQGQQHFEVSESVKVAGESVVVVRVRIEGAFRGKLAERCTLKEASARLVWLRGDRVLSRMEAAASYVRRRRGGEEEPVALKAVLALRQRRRLSDEQQGAVRSSLTTFAEVLGAYQSRRWEEAATLARTFLTAAPDSPWVPAAEWIAARCADQESSGQKLSRLELQRSLAELVIRWEAARGDDDEDLMARTRAAYGQILTAQPRDVRSLATDADENLRALAVFAWSFGTTLEHGNDTLRAARDPSPRVRAWAAAGLAARGDAETDADLLRKLLADDDAEVRARACQAAAACLPPGEPVVGRTRALVLGLLEDSGRLVRLEAARALERAGTPADVATLERAAAVESEANVRSAMKEAVEAIRRRSK